MIRVAAVGDVHFDSASRGRLRPHLDDLADRADVLLVAGDLTCLGTVAEASAVADDLRDLPVPAFAVLGNHDFHSDEAVGVASLLGAAGVRVLEGEVCTIDVDGCRVAVGGSKGFGGGFAGASGSEFGEPEMKAFIAHTRVIADRFRAALTAVGADVRLGLLHYAPIPDTLEGERREIYPFLGSHLLGEAVDEAGANLVVHGHAHAGTEAGATPGGVAVRNVARPVLQRPYAIYEVGADGVKDVA